MSDSESKPKSRHDELPKMRTPSGRFVYDPGAAPEVGADPVKLRGLFEGMERIETMDARDAVPAPFAAAANGSGAIVVAGDDAARAHAEAVIAPRGVPDVPSRPVRIAEAMDPRRQPTQRMGRAAITATAVTKITGTTEGKSATKRGVVWVGGAVAACVIALLAFVTLRPGARDGSGDAGASGGPPAPTMAPAMKSTEVKVIAPITSGVSSATGVQSASDSPSATPKPSTSPSPPPRPTPAPKPLVKPKGPAAPPAVPSSAPSAPPAATPPATVTELPLPKAVD